MRLSNIKSTAKSLYSDSCLNSVKFKLKQKTPFAKTLSLKKCPKQNIHQQRTHINLIKKNKNRNILNSIFKPFFKDEC